MEIKEVTSDTILSEVQTLKSENFRIIQICATTVAEGTYEILYTFGDRYDEVNLRYTVKAGESIPSISHLYLPAFLYENEIHDLFGLEVEDMVLDYRGGLYRTAQKAPFK